jgi:hypothetical protein
MAIVRSCVTQKSEVLGQLIVAECPCDPPLLLWVATTLLACGLDALHDVGVRDAHATLDPPTPMMQLRVIFSAADGTHATKPLFDYGRRIAALLLGACARPLLAQPVLFPPMCRALRRRELAQVRALRRARRRES